MPLFFSLLIASVFMVLFTKSPPRDFPGGSEGKASACSVETQVRSLGWEDPLEKEMATHSSTLAWKISWTEEPSRVLR